MSSKWAAERQQDEDTRAKALLNPFGWAQAGDSAEPRVTSSPRCPPELGGPDKRQLPVRGRRPVSAHTSAGHRQDESPPPQSPIGVGRFPRRRVDKTPALGGVFILSQ